MLGPGDVLDWTFHGGGGWGDPLEANDEVSRVRRSGRMYYRPVAAKIYGVIIDESGVDDKATRRASRVGTGAAARMASGVNLCRLVRNLARPKSHARLAIISCCSAASRADGSSVAIAATCFLHRRKIGNATRGTRASQAEDPGPKVHLHKDLVAEAYACPGCGALISLEVRWKADRPLHDIEIAKD